MPSIWVGVARSTARESMRPSELHGIVSKIEHARNPPRFSAHHERIAPGTQLVTVRVLDDELEPAVETLPRLMASPDWPHAWRLAFISKVRHVPWAELAPAVAPQRARWRVRFTEPTSWSRDADRIPEVDVERLLHSAADRWRAVHPATCPVPRGTRFPHVRLIGSRTIDVRRTEDEASIQCVQGYVDLESRDPTTTPVVVALLRFLELAGTGRHVARGMGVVRLGEIPAEKSPSTYRDRRLSA